MASVLTHDAGGWFLARGLSVSLGGREVLRDVNLDVSRGSILSVVGRSGAGKSTLLYGLAGLIEHAGIVERPEKMSFVFQGYALFPWLTVRENIAFAVRDGSRAERARLIERYLLRTGLVDHASKYPLHLSGGQTQRVALARALAARADAVLMDEPFAALDEYTRVDMSAWLLEIWSESRPAIVVVTHNIDEALFLGDSVVVLSEGRIVYTTSSPFSRPRDRSIWRSESFFRLRSEILDSLGGNSTHTNDMEVLR